MATNTEAVVGWPKGPALERAQRVALFRYQVISPALDPVLTRRQRGLVVRGLASRAHPAPFGGGPRRYSRESLDRWIRAYRSGGFDALLPGDRSPGPRTDPALLDLAAALKRENPARTAAQVARVLAASAGVSPSESTLLRLFKRLELPGPGASPVQAFGRFEAAAPNERWVGDALHGPRIGGAKTYLFAFLDDHSRLAAGYRFGFAEDAVRLALPLRAALASRGTPGQIYVDNGAAYIDAWLRRACAVLNIRLTHATPNRPQGKGKIERFFGTVRGQFLVEVSDSTAEQAAAAGTTRAQGLLELNTGFAAWVETVYHQREHSETGQSPLQRWADGWERVKAAPAVPSQERLTEAFRWSQERRVAKTATVSLLGNTYQVDPALVGRKVELVFDPFDLTALSVRHQGRDYGAAVPHVIGRHAHPRARPETPQEPPPPTGIDYLGLVTGTHQEVLAADARIAIGSLYSDPAQIPGQLPGQTAIEDLLLDADGTDQAVGR